MTGTFCVTVFFEVKYLKTNPLQFLLYHLLRTPKMCYCDFSQLSAKQKRRATRYIPRGEGLGFIVTIFPGSLRPQTQLALKDELNLIHGSSN